MEKSFLIMEVRFRIYHYPGAGVFPVFLLKIEGGSKNVDLSFNFYWIGGRFLILKLNKMLVW